MTKEIETYQEMQERLRKRRCATQTVRRDGRKRIDYYPSKAALAIIDARTAHRVGMDYSSIISRLVLAGAATLPED